MKLSKKIPLKELEKELRSTPKSFFKLKVYFEEIIKSENFQQNIQNLRDKYGIPKDGFVFDPKRYKDFLPLPKKWIYINNINKIIELDFEIKTLVEKYDLYTQEWLTIFWNYLFYNQTFLNFLKDHIFIYPYDLCLINDARERFIDLDDPEGGPYWKMTEEEELKSFPIAIKVSPYATERDIIDFIKKNYKRINLLQKKYQNPNIKIGKFRKKNEIIQKRNEFIWKHRDLPRKKIMYLVNEKFKGKTLGYADIEKILILEHKRRKEL